jgi:hypothetical protein
MYRRPNVLNLAVVNICRGSIAYRRSVVLISALYSLGGANRQIGSQGVSSSAPKINLIRRR